MVAGMLTSLDDLKSIYEVLFRDGVMVSKKDMRPQCMHPDVQGVPNLKVIRAMVSLKSRGFVRETFAWRHSYWYLTNEGIAHVREFLHLPPEIVPSTLQRVRSTVSTLHPMRRAANVQKFKGPTSFVPKPRTKEETQEDVLDRQGYRSKKTLSKEPEDHPEKMVMNFRGSYAPKPSERETGHQEQRFGRRTDSYREEERGTAKSFNKRSTSSYSNAASRPATREAKIETPVKKQQEEPEPSQSVLPEEEKISAAAAMPDPEPTKKIIETVQPFIDSAEESIISPYETVEVDMPVPLMEAVDVELCYAKTEAPQPVSDMPAEVSAQCMEIASDQVSTDLEVLVEEGIAGEVQEPEEFTEIQEQVEVIVEPKEDVLLEQSGPEHADSDVPLAASPVDDDQTVNQEVQESLPEILEPKEQTEEIETFEEPLHQEDVMIHAPDEPKPVVSDESLTLPSTYDEPEAAELDEEVTEVLQEIMVVKDAEELPSVEEVIAAEPAVENEEVLVQKPVADDWLMVSHDEPEGGEQDSDEDELHQAQESAEFGKQSKEVEVVMVQEEIIHASDVMQAMDDPNVPPINTSDVAQNIQEEYLPHIADLEPPVEEMPTSIPAVTSVTPEDVESWQTGLSSLLLSHLPPTMDPSVVPAELEVQDTAVLHGDLNINPPPEDFTALYPGVNVKHPSEEEEKGAAE